ncbi:MAG TPA: DUF58 domain-containing protein [Actinophytocola sp.]|uniref:DUF58 domain-containing protein n=1 Tax=Actinophytocola sp. TaxID=1872138 RepID=UPI002DB800B5|nr:DUF58 domain-containing protein [Actinophytocola sp.]HEU5470588.1 DUF58 domain-containing protein [Actinophytocola sp.]
MTVRRTALCWQLSPLALALLTTSVTALTLAVVGRRPELVAFTAPLLGVLAGIWGAGRPATHVLVHAEPAEPRCFERETVPVRVTATAAGGIGTLSVRPRPPAGIEALPGGLRAGRWGRYRVPVVVTARAAGGLLTATAVVAAIDLRVYPRPPAARTVVRPNELLDRLGVHIGRMRGGGLEFAGIRPYEPGDPLTKLNWLASSRLGRPHVTERLAERATDVVALIDTTNGCGLDLAVHGAAGIAQAALCRGDRAGVLALGGPARWLGPDIGRRQFYRIVDTVLDATGGSSGAPASPPRAALPPRSCVLAFSPLLDARVGPVLADLRARGHTVLVIDVLRRPVTPVDPLITQLWRADRAVLRRDLAAAAIPVLPWTEGASLDEVLADARSFSLPRRRTRETAPGRR